MACTLFCAATTPNPDVVLMYLHEAALGADKVRVEDIGVGGKNDARSPAGLRRNPLGELPALQMRNGQHIAESQSICEYLDAEFGPTPLLGRDPTELAETSMWCRRVEQKVCLKMADAFQNGKGIKFFTARRPDATFDPAVVGPALANARAGLVFIDAMLAADARPFLCGARFSLADIRLHVIFSFFMRADKTQRGLADGLVHFAAWLKRVAARPSAAAIAPKAKL